MKEPVNPNYAPNPDIEPILNLYATPASEVNTHYEQGGYNQENFYSIQGRVGRIRYVAYGILLVLVLIVVLFGFSIVSAILAGLFRRSNGTFLAIIGLLSMLLVIAGYLYVHVVPTKRRLNDLNLSGWWALLWLVPLINILFWLYLVFAPGTSGANKYGLPAEPPSTVMTIVALVMPVFGIVIIAILAAIAIPAYQDYSERAEAANALQEYEIE